MITINFESTHMVKPTRFPKPRRFRYQGCLLDLGFDMWARIKKYFISGLIILVPAALSIYILYIIVSWADSLLGVYIKPYFDEKFGFYVSGLSILIGAYIVILIGFFATNFLGKSIVEFFERTIFLKWPFFRQVYPAIKEMAIFLFSRDQIRQFKQVVLVQYPCKGVYCFGFLTSDTSAKLAEKTKTDLCNVFVPSAPGPFTGYVVMFPRKEIIFTDISIEQAFKYIVSGGVVNPS